MMTIKPKHMPVVIFSSIIITVVIISTLAGYEVYLKWKEDTFGVSYRDSIEKLTAEMLRQNIEIYGVNGRFAPGTLSMKIPILEGKIKNNLKKTINSLTVEIAVSKTDGVVLYKDWFQPIGDEKLSAGSPFFSSIKQTKEALKPGEILQFRYIFKNCPYETLSQICTDSQFSKDTTSKKVKVDLLVSEVSVL